MLPPPAPADRSKIRVAVLGKVMPEAQSSVMCSSLASLIKSLLLRLYGPAFTFIERAFRLLGSAIYLDPPYLIEGALCGNRGCCHKNFDNREMRVSVEHQNEMVEI